MNWEQLNERIYFDIDYYFSLISKFKGDLTFFEKTSYCIDGKRYTFYECIDHLGLNEYFNSKAEQWKEEHEVKSAV